MAIQTVVIRNSGLVFKARPGTLITKPGEQVKFSNYSGGTAVLTFPTGLFDQDQLTLDNTTSNKGTLTAQDVADGPYPYQGSVNGVPVLGDSSPEIIIDR